MGERRIFILIQLFLLFPIFLVGAEFPVEEWLVTQPKIFKPAFTGEPFSFFDYSSLDIKSLWPAEGDKLFWDLQQTLIWQKCQAKEGKLYLSLGDASYLVIAATYLDIPRWQKVILIVKSDFPFQIFLDGELLGKGERTELTITREKHRLLIASIQDHSKQTGIGVSLQFEDKYKLAPPRISTDPFHNLSLLEALTIPQSRYPRLTPWHLSKFKLRLT
jgi:hypothetical protein